ncbi:thioredoxin-1, partial [Sporodiniella umbellata]
GKTIEANAETFGKLVRNADHPVIVDFYADWCGPCKVLAPMLSKVVASNPEVTLVKVNVDDCQEIASEFKVAALPTVSAFYEGKVVDTFVGVQPAKIPEFIKKHAELAKN